MSGSSDTKISTLPAASAIADADVWPVVQGTGPSAATRRAATTMLRQSMQQLTAPALAGAVARTVQGRLDDILSVRDFGAVGDGVTDDTAAFNAFSAAIRAAIDSDRAFTLPFTAVVPPGKYSVSSWDLTALVCRQVHIYCAGAVLIGRTAGKSVVDLLASRWVHLHDLTIYGEETAMPRAGVQVGPSEPAQACGNLGFHNLMVIGYFEDAAYLNVGAETTSCWGGTFENRNVDPAAYAAAFDGQGARYLGESDYVTNTRVANVGVSFSNNAFYGCQIRNAGGGSAVFLCKFSGFHFDQHCYALSLNDAAFVIHTGITYRSAGLVAGVQFENSQNDNPTPGNTGIKYAFKFTTDLSSGVAFEALTVHHATPQCEQALIYNATGQTLRLSLVDIKLQNFIGGDSTPVAFLGSGISLDGSVRIITCDKLNFGALASFSGDIFVGDASQLPSLPPAGSSYRLVDRTGLRATHYGTLYLLNNASTASQVHLGNSGDQGVAVQGSSGATPEVRSEGSLADVNLGLRPKGAGQVRSMGPLALTDGATAQPLIIGTITRIDPAGGYIFPTYSAAQIADATHSVNTTNKTGGKTVRDNTNFRLMVARSSAPTSAWDAADGSASVTPA